MWENQRRVLELWYSVRDRAFWTVSSVTHDKQLTEDVLQEALLIAIKKFHTLRDESRFLS